MKKMSSSTVRLIVLGSLHTIYISNVTASAGDFDKDLKQIEAMSGCYLVDYSFTETESLKSGYSIDRRIYDANLDKTTRELIIPIQKTPTEIRLQHVLFVTGKDGKTQFVMKHQAEDWEYEAQFRYDFVSPNFWEVTQIPTPSGVWTRKVTNLDDGLRYQCSAKWDHSKNQSEWKCGGNFAPIPGRETRDMGRKDYNTLDRSTHLIPHSGSFLERQNNIKTILADGTRTALAKETGKTWYVKQPSASCAEASRWAAPRLTFWKILMEEWQAIYGEEKAIKESALPNGQPRYAILAEIEERYFLAVEKDPEAEKTARLEIRKIIQKSLNPEGISL